VGIQLQKDSIDLGIIVKDGEKAMAFYRDTLGFDHEGDMEMSGGSTMHRLRCGTSLIKVIETGESLEHNPAPGGLMGGTGYRYWTISVSNLEELVAECEANGYTIAVSPREIREGVSIAMVEDPDGNWVELLQNS
jgi:glyoxylase I family protein